MQQNAFLQTICANPEDDAPRLVYADWLDERGNPLGEFIRVQVELARIKESRPRYGMLRARQLELMLAHVPLWVQPYGMQILGAEFKRGFMCAGTVETELLVKDQPWFERWPWEVLRLRNTDWYFNALLDCRLLARLKMLDLSRTRLEDYQMAALARSDVLRYVRWIELGNNIPSSSVTADLLRAFGDNVRWSRRWR